MKILSAGLLLLVCGLSNVLRVMGTTVGLYAPDRYDGIPEMCLMPMDFGYCRAKVKRYYFDMHRMKCTMFYWGGCAGNINNFKSLEECNKLCVDAFIDSIDEQQPKGRDSAARTAPSGGVGGKSQYNNTKTTTSARNFKYDPKAYQPKSSAVGDAAANNKNERTTRKNDESVEYEYDE